MAHMDISLPDSVKAFIEARVTEGGYSTPSEYFGDLVRDDQKRQAQKKLEVLLLEGLESGTPIEVNEAYWQKKRASLLARHQENTKSV